MDFCNGSDCQGGVTTLLTLSLDLPLSALYSVRACRGSNVAEYASFCFWRLLHLSGPDQLFPTDTGQARRGQAGNERAWSNFSVRMNDADIFFVFLVLLLLSLVMHVTRGTVP